MKKIIKGFDIVIDWLSICFLLSVVFVVILQIIFRFVIQKPLSWSEEFSRYAFIWVVYLGGYVCTRNNAHLGITFFVDSLPHVPQKIINFIATAAVFIYMIFVVIWGFQLSFKVMRQPSAVMRIPMGYVYMAIPIGMLLMIIRMIFNLLEHHSMRAEGSL